jgi:hypothetical protein
MTRVMQLFCLDDNSENENESLFNFMLSLRDEAPFCVLVALKALGDIIKKFPYVFSYVKPYNSVN